MSLGAWPTFLQFSLEYMNPFAARELIEPVRSYYASKDQMWLMLSGCFLTYVVYIFRVYVNSGKV
jgi:hypothetical protein